MIHATHCYNRTPLRRLKWQTPYTALHGEAPDISHLRVFGCGAYVHIPKETRANALAPKSELMVYLGQIEGMKAYTFMRISNNTVYTSTTALFDETLYPKCDTSKTRGVTRLKQPANEQPSEAEEDTTPGDFDIPSPPIQKKDERPKSDDTSEAPEESSIKFPSVEPPQRPPSPPVPAPAPRRSARLRKVPIRPDNIYGDRRHPTEIEKDVERSRTWKRMTEPQPSRSRAVSNSPTPMPGDFPDPSSEIPLPQSDDEVDELLCHAREGGVEFQNYLLARAVPLSDSDSPDTTNIRKWSFCDILNMPPEKQKEWKQACREELDSLRR